MAKFCGNCGTQMEDNAAFCPNCGNAVEVSASASKKTNNKLVGIIACAAVVVIALIIALTSGGNYKSVAKKYVESFLKFDYRGIKSTLIYDVDELFEELVDTLVDQSGMSKKEVFEMLSDELDVKIKDTDDIFRKMFEVAEKEIKDEYGKYSVKVKVVDAEELDEDEIEDAVYWQSFAGLDMEEKINEKKIKKAYEVELKTTIDYADDDIDDDTEEFTVVVAKYGLKWKVIDTRAFDLY